jgi:uncharacterized protein (TIGR03435 family)
MNMQAFWSENGTALVNHLWQSTVVVGVAWVLASALKKNHARVRYWIWMAASVKFLLPFSLLMAAGERLRSLLPAPVATEPVFAGAVEQMTQPFFAAPAFEPGEVPAAAHHAGWLWAALLALWLAGALAVVFRFARAWWRVSAARRAARPLELAAGTSVHAVPVLAAPALLEPGVFGIFRPVLLLPEGILGRLTREQMRAILAHEMCHVCRRDNLTFVPHMVVEALFWFHPAVWWIGSRLIDERERACDEAVVQQGAAAGDYAEGILNVCKFYVESPLACVSGVTGADLKKRIAQILAGRRAFGLTWPRKLLLSATVAMAVALPVGLGLVHATQSRAQSAPANPGQNIAATWQGILHTDRDLRIVVEITKAGDGTLRALYYNIDNISEAPDGVPAISTLLNGSLLKFELPFGSYEGTVIADGNSIAGTWRQGTNSLPLNFARATTETAWTIPKPPPRLPAMAADANPRFEVASIKLSRPDEHGPRFWFENRRFSVVHTSLGELVKFSYGLQQREIVGAPDWFTSESFDISAEPDGEGEPSFKQWQSMVGKLMADRFQLKFHYEKRELPVYVLTVAKTGPKLTRSQSANSGLGFGPPGNFGATDASMGDFAQAMGQAVLDRPVVDETGLAGKFDFRLTWTPDETQFGAEGGYRPPASESADAPPHLFEAIQEELGLKLESAKAPVDVLVIDHVEQPSPN